MYDTIEHGIQNNFPTCYLFALYQYRFNIYKEDCVWDEKKNYKRNLTTEDKSYCYVFPIS